MNYQFNVSFVLSSVREYSDLRPRESERSKNICLAKMAIDVDNNNKKIFKVLPIAKSNALSTFASINVKYLYKKSAVLVEKLSTKNGLFSALYSTVTIILNIFCRPV